jgi:hypothetical protein
LTEASAEEVFEGGLDRDRLVFLEVDLAVDRHSGADEHEALDDDIFLEAAEVVDSAGDAGLGKYPCNLPERCGGDEAVR